MERAGHEALCELTGVAVARSGKRVGGGLPLAVRSITRTEAVGDRNTKAAQNGCIEGVMTKFLLGIAMATLLAVPAIAKGPIGTQVLPIEVVSASVYVACLDEDVIGYVSGETRYHEFQTSSGTIHVLDKWSVTGYLVGQTTGRVWRADVRSPFQLNAKLENGVVNQYVESGRYLPLEGHAPAIISSGTWKITVNANGDLVVLHEMDAQGWHCVGPKD